MLQEVIRLQNRAVTSLVEEIGGKREVTFKAPTGQRQDPHDGGFHGQGA